MNIKLLSFVQLDMNSISFLIALSSDWNWCSTGTTVAGTGVQGYQPNQLSSPYQVKIGSDGALYVADSNYNHRISKWIIGSGSSTIVAGQSYPQSGSSLSLFNQPYGVYLDSTGKMYVTDTMNHRVMLWNNSATSGSIVAGNGTKNRNKRNKSVLSVFSLGTSGNSLNQLANPYSVTLDESSNKLYIADCNNHRIIGVQLSTLTPSLVAGGIGFGHSTAHLYYPTDIYWDSSTNSLYIVNNGNSIIIRWVIGGTGWTLVAGFVNIASATSMTFNSPIGLTFDSAGNLYVADTSNHRIQFLRSGDATGKTIAGVSGIAGSTSNSLYNPRFVAVDSQFNLYVADTNNYRVQMFRRC